MMQSTARKHMTGSIQGGVVVMVHDDKNPSDAEWRAWMELYETSLSEVRAVVVYSLGGGPSPTQRAQIVDLVERRAQAIPTVVVTASRLARGVLMAINWFVPEGRRAKAYRPDQLQDALDELDLDAQTRRRVSQAITDHLHELGVNPAEATVSAVAL